jgi:hypothetical protein
MLKKFGKPRVIRYTREYTPEHKFDKSIYIAYRNHLIENKQHIIQTGYPLRPFKQHLGLDLALSKIYPIKLPLHVNDNNPFFRNMDYMNTTPDIYKEMDEFRYIWSDVDPLPNFQSVYDATKKITPRALIKNILPLLNEEQVVPYSEAQNMYFLSAEDIETIGENRELLFHLKMRLIDVYIETIENNLSVSEYSERAISNVFDFISFEQMVRLVSLEEKYREHMADKYLNKLLIPLVHYSAQIIFINKIQVKSKDTKVKPHPLLNCGGISDFLFAIGNFGEMIIASDVRTREYGSKKKLSFEFHRLRRDYWYELKYLFERFIEEQMEHEVTITTSMKGKYIEKYLPILEKMIGIESEYINESGELLNIKELSGNRRSKPDKMDETQSLFRKAGEGFEIAFNGRPSFFLKETVGLNYIYILMSNKNKVIPLHELVYFDRNSGESGSKPIDTYVDSLSTEGGGSNNEYVTEDFKMVVKELQSLLEEKEEANESGNYEKAERLQYKIEELQEYIREAKNIKKNPELERMRTKVRNAITSAIKKVKTNDPELARHFEERISTGYTCMYYHYPSKDIEWTFS